MNERMVNELETIKLLDSTMGGVNIKLSSLPYLASCHLMQDQFCRWNYPNSLTETYADAHLFAFRDDNGLLPSMIDVKKQESAKLNLCKEMLCFLQTQDIFKELVLSSLQAIPCGSEGIYQPSEMHPIQLLGICGSFLDNKYVGLKEVDAFLTKFLVEPYNL